VVQADNDDGPTRAIRILVVEDNAALLRTTVRMLADSGYEVLTAENGAEALRLLGGGQRVDILFTDVVLPGALLGHQLAQRAVAMLPGLKVLYTSGSASAAGDIQGLVNVDDLAHVLPKPYLRRDLLARLRALIP